MSPALCSSLVSPHACWGFGRPPCRLVGVFCAGACLLQPCATHRRSSRALRMSDHTNRLRRGHDRPIMSIGTDRARRVKESPKCGKLREHLNSAERVYLSLFYGFKPALSERIYLAATWRPLLLGLGSCNCTNPVYLLPPWCSLRPYKLMFLCMAIYSQSGGPTLFRLRNKCLFVTLCVRAHTQTHARTHPQAFNTNVCTNNNFNNRLI